MNYDDYWRCPVCGQEVALHHRSEAWEDSHWPHFWGTKGNRKGVCQQLGPDGERAMVHFVVEIEQAGRKHVSHRRWTQVETGFIKGEMVYEQKSTRQRQTR
jgi:hypothetical protein